MQNSPVNVSDVKQKIGFCLVPLKNTEHLGTSDSRANLNTKMTKEDKYT